MRLAVLFVGLFGGDIVSTSGTGADSTVPAVVGVTLFAFVATIFVARWGFRGPPDDEVCAALRAGRS